jgi:hypothetical protein
MNRPAPSETIPIMHIAAREAGTTIEGVPGASLETVAEAARLLLEASDFRDDSQ